MQNWISQIVISKSERMGLRKPPMAFTEQGIAMLSSVLRSKPAVAMNVQIMRTFVQMREITRGNEQLWRKIESLEKHYDEQFKIVFDALRGVITEDATKSEIGYTTQ